MHLLVAINNNTREWADTLVRSKECPRLPLPYAFGAAFLKRGHKLSAINVSPVAQSGSPGGPFEAVYSAGDLSRAMRNVDYVSLWGGQGLSAVMRQFLLRPRRKRVVFNSYVWSVDNSPTFRCRKAALTAHVAARFAKAVVLMTHEQAEAAKAALSGGAPVITLRIGIDTSFYEAKSSFEDVPEVYRKSVEKLITKPYMILPGDELRFNEDALDLVAGSGVAMVRISQYSRGDMQGLHQEIVKRGLLDRFPVFENISYPFMRFLFQNAAVYAGLVNSEWQPAGWTTACEAIASGTPVVAYEGLVTRELKRLGADDSFLRASPMHDTRKFTETIGDFLVAGYKQKLSAKISSFAKAQLDLEVTGEDFAGQLEGAL